MQKKAANPQEHHLYQGFIPGLWHQVCITRYFPLFAVEDPGLLDGRGSNLHSILWPHGFYFFKIICLWAKCIFLYKKNSIIYAHYLYCSISMLDSTKISIFESLIDFQIKDYLYFSYFLQVASFWGLNLFLKTNIVLG